MPTIRERQQIKAIVQGIGRLSARQVAALTLDIHGRLVRDTPVDTGWARANWVPRTGRPIGEAVGSPGSAGVAAAQAAANTGLSDVLSYNFSKGRVFVTNNVPYIEALNDGSSPQTAAGFVQKAIREAVRAVVP